jgi:hypothetical protein
MDEPPGDDGRPLGLDALAGLECHDRLFDLDCTGAIVV